MIKIHHNYNIIYFFLLMKAALLKILLSFWARFLKGRLTLSRIKLLFRFGILHSYALLRVTFCVIITISRSKGSTVFCNLELHVLRRENRA